MSSDAQATSAITALLARRDVAQFVEHHANTFITVDAFMQLEMPPGLSPHEAFDLVEFVRRTGAGTIVCGRRRGCDHEGSWYALTPAFSAKLAHLTYRTRPRGSLQQQFDQFRAAKGFYPPRLQELACSLSLDGVDVPYETLRELALHERNPHGAAEQLAANALKILCAQDATESPVLSKEGLDELFVQLEEDVGALDYRPFTRPPTVCRSTCDLLSTGFIVDLVQESQPLSGPPIMLLLFCSDGMWKASVFPRWNNTMELLVRNLLFGFIGSPLLGYVPLALPFWRWQMGMANNDVAYDDAMFATRYGVDMTLLFWQLLDILERGVDELATWVREQRELTQKRRDTVRTSCTLNHRQQAFVLDLIGQPELRISAPEYERRYDVAASTAYADLQKLVDRGLLVIEMQGKTRTFRPSASFGAILDRGLGL